MTRQERIVRPTDKALGARREARAYSRKPLSGFELLSSYRLQFV